jgi:hypothetical protein
MTQIQQKAELSFAFCSFPGLESCSLWMPDSPTIARGKNQSLALAVCSVLCIQVFSKFLSFSTLYDKICFVLVILPNCRLCRLKVSWAELESSRGLSLKAFSTHDILHIQWVYLDSTPSQTDKQFYVFFSRTHLLKWARSHVRSSKEIGGGYLGSPLFLPSCAGQ